MIRKRQALKSKILDDIHKKRLKAGDSIPSRNFLMKKYGYARGTVDKAVNDLLQEGILSSRRGSGTYVTSHLESGESKIENLYIIENYISGDPDVLHAKVQKCASNFQRHINTRILSSDDILINSEKIASSRNAILWVCPPYEELGIMKYFQKTNTEQVIVGRNYADFDYITTDAYAGIGEGLKWLVNCDFKDRRVAFVSRKYHSDYPYLAERQIAFYENAIKMNIEIDYKYLFFANFAELMTDVENIGNSLFREKDAPKLIFLNHIPAAIPLMSYARACGKQHGKDFRILIFDDENSLKKTPGIAMLRQKWEEMEKHALEWIFSPAFQKNEIKLKIKPELITN